MRVGQGRRAHPRRDPGRRRSRSSTSCNGGASFATLAQEKSTDTTSGAQGGALGCLTPGAFVPAFQTAAEAAPFDTPVGPVQSQFGYHVILVTHADAELRGVARRRCSRRSRSRVRPPRRPRSTTLLKSFKVHVDPRFGTWGPVTDGQGQSVYR